MPGAYFKRWEPERRYRLFNINPKAIQDIIEGTTGLHPDYTLSAYMLAPWQLSIHIHKRGVSGMASAIASMRDDVFEQEITELWISVQDLRIEDMTLFYGAMESVLQSIIAMHNIIRNVGGVTLGHKATPQEEINGASATVG